MVLPAFVIVVEPVTEMVRVQPSAVLSDTLEPSMAVIVMSPKPIPPPPRPPPRNGAMNAPSGPRPFGPRPMLRSLLSPFFGALLASGAVLAFGAPAGSRLDAADGSAPVAGA